MNIEEVTNFLTLLLFTPNCSESIFIENDLNKFVANKCHVMLLSKCLGYAIIIGSVLVKFPQIIKIWTARSSEGLSFSSQALELCAVSTSVAYSYARRFPFSAYGEGIFLCLQTALIAFLVLAFRGHRIRSYLFAIFFGSAMYFLMSPLAPLHLLALLQATNLPIVAAAKLLQALTNARQGHTGELSLVTMTLLTLGSAARVFTTIQETGDQLVMLSYVISAGCNSILVLQIFWYWKVKRNASASQSKQSKKTQ